MNGMSSAAPHVILRNGVRMPQLGLGVFQVGDDDVSKVVGAALEYGYRSIDTAALYGNEQGVGAAIAGAGIPREDIFITTKLWNADHGRDRVGPALERSLDKLRLDYVDLYLIHWPVPSVDRYVDTWRAFERLYADGRVRAIGVSNFTESHLRRVIDETSIVPAVNQVELHPYFQQTALRALHRERGIITEAWSPLGQGAALRDPTITELARRHGWTAAQIVLRWHLDSGHVAIPKSVTPQRIRENFDALEVELSPDEGRAIDTLDRGTRIGPDPDVVGSRPTGFSTAIDPTLT
jgi:diketogulonate reductase-like aldo/keto reductase